MRCRRTAKGRRTYGALGWRRSRSYAPEQKPQEGILTPSFVPASCRAHPVTASAPPRLIGGGRMNDTIETRWEQENEAGRLSFTDGDFARAEQSFLAAIREATKLGADNVRLASSLSNLGQLKYKQKDFAQAEALFHRALAIRERVLGPEHFGLVQNINNLAALHYARNELDQAEPLFQRALGISQQHLGESHPDVAV